MAAATVCGIATTLGAMYMYQRQQLSLMEQQTKKAVINERRKSRAKYRQTVEYQRKKQKWADMKRE